MYVILTIFTILAYSYCLHILNYIILFVWLYTIPVYTGKVLIFVSGKADTEDLSRQLQQYLTLRRLDIKVGHMRSIMCVTLWLICLVILYYIIHIILLLHVIRIGGVHPRRQGPKRPHIHSQRILQAWRHHHTNRYRHTVPWHGYQGYSYSS